jgi:hypothetical protein
MAARVLLSFVQNGGRLLKVSAKYSFLPFFEVAGMGILRERAVREDLGGRQASSQDLY